MRPGPFSDAFASQGGEGAADASFVQGVVLALLDYLIGGRGAFGEDFAEPGFGMGEVGGRGTGVEDFVAGDGDGIWLPGEGWGGLIGTANDGAGEGLGLAGDGAFDGKQEPMLGCIFRLGGGRVLGGVGRGKGGGIRDVDECPDGAGGVGGDGGGCLVPGESGGVSLGTLYGEDGDAAPGREIGEGLHEGAADGGFGGRVEPAEESGEGIDDQQAAIGGVLDGGFEMLECRLECGAAEGYGEGIEGGSSERGDCGDSVEIGAGRDESGLDGVVEVIFSREQEDTAGGIGVVG